MATRIRMYIDYVPDAAPGSAGAGGAFAGDHIQVPILNVVDTHLPKDETERDFVLNLFRLSMFSVRNNLVQSVGARAVSTNELHEDEGTPVPLHQTQET